jgi:NAD(P)-dependent dehydrogenase (short-subunit alcohol dehydrogenase family)
MRLKGRRILITGAASGIGRATAELFAAEGASLALLDRDGPGLAAIAQSCGAAKVVTQELDLADSVAIPAAVEGLAAGLNGLDGIVNAAGILILRSLEDLDPQTWRRTMDICLTAPYLVCRAALPALKLAGAGTIVNIASGAGLRPSGVNNSAYAAAKAGLIAFGKAMAMELAQYEIRVNSVCPGSVDTPMLHSTLSAGVDVIGTVGAAYALKRIAQPREIANAILYLSSAESSFVTGTAHAVDGGRTYY